MCLEGGSIRYAGAVMLRQIKSTYFPWLPGTPHLWIQWCIDELCRRVQTGILRDLGKCQGRGYHVWWTFIWESDISGLCDTSPLFWVAKLLLNNNALLPVFDWLSPNEGKVRILHVSHFNCKVLCRYEFYEIYLMLSAASGSIKIQQTMHCYVCPFFLFPLRISFQICKKYSSQLLLM